MVCLAKQPRELDRPDPRAGLITYTTGSRWFGRAARLLRCV